MCMLNKELNCCILTSPQSIIYFYLNFEFIKFMNYCRDLKFEEKPDYSYLRKIFKDLFSSLGYEYDFVYDWTPILKK